MSTQLPSITLRAIEPEDLDELYQIENDETTWDVGTTNVPYSRYALHNYIANSTSDIYTDRQVRLIISDSNNQTIGLIDIVHFDPQHSRAEICIIIKQAYRNQGYGHAALEIVIAHARNLWHLHQLYAIVATDNTGSLHLFRTAGFHHETPLKSWLRTPSGYSDALLMQTFL